MGSMSSGQLTTLPGLLASRLLGGVQSPQLARLSFGRAAPLWQFGTCHSNHHKGRLSCSPFHPHSLGEECHSPFPSRAFDGGGVCDRDAAEIFLQGGDGKLVWEGAMGKVVQVEYGACEWVNPDLEEGIWVLQAGFLDSCA